MVNEKNIEQAADGMNSSNAIHFSCLILLVLVMLYLYIACLAFHLPSVEAQLLEGVLVSTNEADDLTALREIIAHTSSIFLIFTPCHMLNASSTQFSSTNECCRNFMKTGHGDEDTRRTKTGSG